jgi:hypothetical protein
MQTGKSKSSQKTRQPYGKVTEVGQVPIALQEIKELARGNRSTTCQVIEELVSSIIAVTCANPGCISEIAAQSAHVQPAA